MAEGGIINEGNEFLQLSNTFSSVEIDLLKTIVIQIGPPSNWRPKNYKKHGDDEINPGIATLLLGKEKLRFRQRFIVAMFTWNNGADPKIIDEWLHVRKLLSDRQAYSHMKIYLKTASSSWFTLK